MKNLSISPEDLRRNYKSDYIQGLTKDATSLSKTIIGQERALKALQLGLGNQSQGFNVFVTGASGLGKETVIRELLESIAKKEASPKDWCYVLNFNDAYSPKYLSLPKGFGRELKKDLKKFLLEARVALNKNMTSKEYLAEKETITKELYKKELKLLEPIQTKAKEENFFIQRTPVEINAFPEKDGRPMTDQEFLELPKEEKDRIIKASNEFQRALQQLTQEVEKLNSTYRDKEELLEQRIGSLTLDKYLTKLKEKYTSEPDVLEFLEAIKMDVLERLQNFLKFSPNLSPLEQNILLEKEGMMPLRYEVNILVDNSETHGAPVVFEPNPTYHNLFGKIEKENQRGTFSTNFSLIRAGALHRANGGYLVLPIEGVLKNYLSWDSLKRTLKEGAVRIEDIGEQLGFLTTRSLRPKDIPLNVQVILIGKPIYYHLLYHYDDEFKKFFKVRADFDTSMPATDANIRDLLLLLDKVQQEKSLLPLSLEAKTRLLQYSHRLAEDQLRLSTKMGHLMDIYQEANHYAHQSKLSTINETLIELV